MEVSPCHFLFSLTHLISYNQKNPVHRRGKIYLAVLLSKNEECKELGLKCAKYEIPYYIARHNFERTDFVKWLEECSVWINDKSQSSFEDIFEYW